MKFIWLIGITAIWVAGCAPADKMTEKATPSPVDKPVARQAVEGFTGKTAVDAGERAKAKIKGINTQRRQNFEEIPP